MCGLIAAFSSEPLDGKLAEVNRALDTLSHRGPDGRGLYVSDDRRVVLGHRHLNVFSTTDTRQPIATSDRRLCVIVNGEIYNETALRAQLRTRGAVFRTCSDSEIVLHLYDQFGLDLFEHIEGEFAFVLVDAVRNRFIAARDRFGVKPLVWTRLGPVVAVASESKALIRLGYRPAWSPTSLAAASVHQYLHPGTTLFQGIRAVRPGTAMVWSDSAPQELTYHNLPFRCPETTDCGPLRDALNVAVKRRLRGESRPAFALSSGVDSGSILALAQETDPEPFDAFGLRFDDPRADESGLAAETAVYLGSRFNPVDASRARQLDVLPEAIVGSECLAINGQLPAKYLLSRAIRDHGYKVVLTGEGADELLLGYAHLRMDAQPERGDTVLSGERAVMLPSGDVTSAYLVKRLGFMPTFLRAKLEIGRSFRALFLPEIAGDIDEDSVFAGLLAPIRLDHRGMEEVDISCRIWTRTALADYILRALGDGTEMQHSVEGRTPFLDTGVVNAAARLETNALVAAGEGKLALRRCMAGALPEAVCFRPKRPLVTPPIFWDADGQIASDVRDRLLDSTPPFLFREAIEKRLKRLRRLEERARRREEPSLFMAYCASVLQQAFEPTWSES